MLVGLLLASQVSVHALTRMSKDEMSKVNGREGFVIDAKINFTLDHITYTDCDGDNGNCAADEGIVQLGSGVEGITVDNGTGGPIVMNGITVDAGPSALSNGNGAIVMNLPDESFDVNVDETYLGTSANSAFEMDVSGFDLGGINVDVGAN
jgi:hypothetical protein